MRAIRTQTATGRKYVHSPLAGCGNLDQNATQWYRCVMIPQFDADGLLPPGIHRTHWDEVVGRFGTSPWRHQLLAGLRMALDSLSRAGCQTVYIDGSFVTDKEVPNDLRCLLGGGRSGAGVAGPSPAAL